MAIAFERRRVRVGHREYVADRVDIVPPERCVNSCSKSLAISSNCSARMINLARRARDPGSFAKRLRSSAIS